MGDDRGMSTYINPNIVLPLVRSHDGGTAPVTVRRKRPLLRNDDEEGKEGVDKTFLVFTGLRRSLPFS